MSVWNRRQQGGGGSTGMMSPIDFIGAASRVRRAFLLNESYEEEQHQAPRRGGYNQPNRAPQQYAPKGMGKGTGFGGGGGASSRRAVPTKVGGGRSGGGGVPREAVAAIEISRDSDIVANGYPSTTFAIIHEKRQAALEKIFNQVDEIFGRLVEIDSSEDEPVSYQHDDDWSIFPDVGDALAQSTIKDPESFCLAFAPICSVWSVGLSRSKSTRFAEKSALLALCLMIAPDHEQYSQVCNDFPDFHQLCVDNDLPSPHGVPATRSAAVPQRMAVRNGGGAPSGGGRAQQYQQQPPLKKVKVQAESRPVYEAPVATSQAPQDKPLSLSLPDDFEMPEPLIGFCGDFFAVCTSGPKPKGMYNRAENAIFKMIGNEEASQIEYIDDPDWNQFPQIAERLQEFGLPEECMIVGICPSRQVFCICMGNKSKNRQAGVRGAMAATLAYHLESNGEEVDISEYEALCEFISSGQPQ